MRAIVSVLGKDAKGIIANVSMTLYKQDVNIIDISQTVMQNEYFTMIMLVEIGEGKTIDDISKALDVVAKEFKVEIRVQHEDIFNSMHRIWGVINAKS